MIDVKGVQPFWFAFEEPVPADEKVFCRSWFKEVDPPYRKGQGIRIRFGQSALHLGLCWRSGAKSELQVVGYELPDVSSDVIGRWGQDDAEDPQEDR